LGRRPPLDSEELRQNLLLASPGLDAQDFATLAGLADGGRAVSGQLSLWLLGTPNALPQALYPLALVLALLGLSVAGQRATARRCTKCGRSACRRCDAEVGVGGTLCGQCITVFTKRAAVAPQVKVRKQLEIDRFDRRKERLSWLLGLACAGGGHLLAGKPLWGAAFAFGFLFLASALLLREGLLRAPFGDLPLWLRVAPPALALATVYLFSLRSLRKLQVD
jgi:hypothetical protein